MSHNNVPQLEMASPTKLLVIYKPPCRNVLSNTLRYRWCMGKVYYTIITKYKIIITVSKMLSVHSVRFLHFSAFHQLLIKLHTTIVLNEIIIIETQNDVQKNFRMLNQRGSENLLIAQLFYM